MTLVDPLDFRRRWSEKFEVIIERISLEAQNWPEAERKGALQVLTRIARAYPDLLGLTHRLEKEAEEARKN